MLYPVPDRQEMAGLMYQVSWKSIPTPTKGVVEQENTTTTTTTINIL